MGLILRRCVASHLAKPRPPMTKLFTQIHDEKKKKINISIDADLKAELTAQRDKDGVSISERIESLYRSHKIAIEAIKVPDDAFLRSRGERGEPMFSNAIRKVIGIFLTPSAIAFFDSQAQQKGVVIPM